MAVRRSLVTNKLQPLDCNKVVVVVVEKAGEEVELFGPAVIALAKYNTVIVACLEQSELLSKSCEILGVEKCIPGHKQLQAYLATSTVDIILCKQLPPLKVKSLKVYLWLPPRFAHLSYLQALCTRPHDHLRHYYQFSQKQLAKARAVYSKQTTALLRGCSFVNSFAV